jgi:hypothetical protein
MAKQNKPRGRQPVADHSGGCYTGAVQRFAIAAGGSATYAVGDVVKSAAGTDVNGVPLVVKAVAADVPLGIVVGVFPVNAGVSLEAANLDLTRTWLPVGQAGYVMVATDPHIMFEVQVDNTNVTLANSSKNALLTITADQTASLKPSSPYSNTVLDGISFAVTNTHAIRLLGLAQREGNQPDSGTNAGPYSVYLAKFNKHEYAQQTGFTAP